MERMRVKLKCHYTDARGGGNVPGDVCSIPKDVAQRLIKMGQAVPLEPLPSGEPPARTGAVSAPVTKPATPGELKGLAKMRWLREQITAAGGTPTGRKLAELEAEYEAL